MEIDDHKPYGCIILYDFMVHEQPEKFRAFDKDGNGKKDKSE